MNRWYAIFPLLLLFTTGAVANIDTLIQQEIIKAENLRNSGKSEEALILLKKVRKEKDFINANCAVKANYYHKIGVYNYDLYNSKETLTYWQDSALHIRLNCLGGQHQETANSYYAVALAYRDLGNKEKESKYMLSAIEIQESLPEIDSIGLAYKYLQIGTLYDKMGDFELAENYLLYAQQFYKSLKIKWHDEVAETLKSLGILKNHQQKYGEAIDYFRSSIDTYSNIEGRNNEQDIADCYKNLGNVYFNQKNYKIAKENALKALNRYKKLKLDSKISHSYELLGNISKRQKSYSKALHYFQESLKLRMEFAQPDFVANTYENIADVFAEQNQFDQALKNYEASISYLMPSMHDGSNGQQTALGDQLVINKLDLLRVMYLKSKTLLTRYEKEGVQEDLLSAYSVHQKLDTLIVNIRQSFKASSSKFFLAQESMPIYEKAIETAIHLYEQSKDYHYLEEAYVFCAKNKAIVLLDGHQDLNAKFAGIPEALLQKERTLKKEYSVLEGKMFSFIGQEKKDSIYEVNKHRLFEVRRELEKLVSQLEKEYPNYYELKYAFPSLLTIKTLQDSLVSGQAIIEYFVGDRQIFIFTILKNKINYQIVAKPDDFGERCQLFRKLSSGEMIFNEEQFRSSANSMFDLLLKEPLNNLGQSIDRLIIIPDGLLLQISFDNLFYKKAKKGESFPYIIRKYAVATAYSNQLLFQSYLLEKLDRPDRIYAGFGLEYSKKRLEDIQSISGFREGPGSNDELAKLIYSDDEVQEIANLLNGTVWINEEATKSNFLENARKFRILHLAMHGVIDVETPLNSSLIFSKDSDSTDFILRARELYSHELNTEMVVLSACHTGTGRIAKGEGIRSFARAFAYAGSPALVTSLWRASDYSTKEILVPFYQYLKEGMPKDIALQQAKLDYINNAPPAYSVPAYWSHLTVVGNTKQVSFNTSNRNWMIWVFGGLTLLGLYVLSTRMMKSAS